MIKSNKVYTPKDYLRYIGISVEEDKPMGDIPLNFIHKVLQENNKTLWDYPLDFYNNIQHEHPDIVLVNCTYYNREEQSFIQEYRWFEV
jgi:hypothetical protein